MEDAFIGSILKEPDAAIHYLAFADWLIDRNEPGDLNDAFALRWMVKHNKRPFNRLRHNGGWAVSGKYSWGWYKEATPGYQRWNSYNPNPPDTAFLPRSVFAAIVNNDHIYFSSWLLAFNRLSVALTEVHADIAV